MIDFSQYDVIQFSAWGKIETMQNKGQNYPYDCIAKDKHPDSYIFIGDNGWIASYELIHIKDNLFTTKVYEKIYYNPDGSKI